MARRSGLFALGAGFVVGGAVAGLFGLLKVNELTRRGQQLSDSLTAQGSALETYLAAQGDRVASELERVAQAEAEQASRRAADDYMGRVYGLTPQRIEGIKRLAAIVEPIGRLF